MAHFAELDSNNIVTRVIVVSNNDVIDIYTNQEEEQIGINFCAELFGTTNWKQTSYSGKFRHNFAGVGYYYDEEKDAFIPPKPFESWVLNDKFDWEAPVPLPEDHAEKIYNWDEDLQQWVNPNS